MLGKFIGDAMMCIFGTPVPHDDDPDRAVRTIDMMVQLNAFNVSAKDGKMPIDHGMGVNTDNVVSVISANGWTTRLLVMGESCRSHHACKQYVTILISSCCKACKATVPARLIL